VKHWVSLWRVPPPANQVISVRHGSSVCFAAYSRVLDQWFLIANGSEEEIAAPEMWFCDDEYAAQHQINGAVEPQRERVSLRVDRRPRQLQLFGDSVSLSGRAA